MPKLEVRPPAKGDPHFRLVFTDDKGSVRLGRQFAAEHHANRTLARYARPENHHKLAARVARARGETQRVRGMQDVPREKE